MSLMKNLLIVAAIAGAGVGARHVLKHELTAQEIAGHFNASIELPAKIDDDVTIRSVTGYGDQLVFTYSLDHYEKSSIDADVLAALDADDKASICGVIRKMMQADIDQDIKLTREYLNAYGTKIHATVVPVTACS